MKYYFVSILGINLEKWKTVELHIDDPPIVQFCSHVVVGWRLLASTSLDFIAPPGGEVLDT